jgi:Mlc titration factor MtfA (ptsG expression regulator)
MPLNCSVLDATVITFVLLAAVVLIAALLMRRPKKKNIELILPDNYRALLEQHVSFYQRLNEEKKKQFESKVQGFLSSVRITGVNTEVTELDRVLVAASAIIPIFSFANWEYINLNEVLLYPENFSEDFGQEGEGRNILGMVGSGAMQNTMVISQHDLRQGFLNKSDKTNTAIHEFVHLIDKTDGATDGIPENLIAHQYIAPWLKLMHQNINEIQKGKSDINPYGSKNEAEFFAVASEYFFEKPDLLHQKHPELFAMLEQIFRRDRK